MPLNLFLIPGQLKRLMYVTGLLVLNIDVVGGLECFAFRIISTGVFTGCSKIFQVLGTKYQSKLLEIINER